MTMDEIIFVFCDARVSCEWKEMAIIQVAHCTADKKPSFKGPQDAVPDTPVQGFGHTPDTISEHLF